MYSSLMGAVGQTLRASAKMVFRCLNISCSGTERPSYVEGALFKFMAYCSKGIALAPTPDYIKMG